MIRVLNHLTWKVFAEFTHLSTVRGPCAAAVFKEVDEPLQLDMSELSLSDEFAKRNADNAAETYIQVRYDVMEVPITLPSQKPPAEKPNPKQGIGEAEFISKFTCFNSFSYFALSNHFQHANGPLDMGRATSRARSHLDTKRSRSSCSLGSNMPPTSPMHWKQNLYMWTPSGAYCINAPFPNFSIFDLKWNSDGSCLLLKDKESFCCAAVPLLQESSDYSSED
ncbi:UNVERIFIED_CONTAM: hypothetical protein Sangu_2493300 [Sesamum angustifolium]|uniref:Uncharacterized protein n=1 Tax=Sesamum angustifolium TaxID=2727405 RepID=A0AAW2KDE0_9LAMI